MYTHFSKGFTVGQALTRRVMRFITGLPVVIFDVIIATFWSPDFASYWEDVQIPNADGTKTKGFCRGVLGWVGDIAGCVVGAIVGSAIGVTCYIPDAILRGVSWAYDKTKEGLDNFATTIGSHSLCDSFKTVNPPQNYMEKTWNISVGTLGLVIATPLYLIAKAIETFLPIGNTLSNALWKTGGIAGGIVGSIIGMVVYPVKRTCDKLVNLFRGFREKVRSLTAYIYAKTDQDLTEGKDLNSCIHDDAIHSPRFREKIPGYKKSSTAQILFGARKPDVVASASEHVIEKEGSNKSEGIPYRQLHPTAPPIPGGQPAVATAFAIKR